MANVEKLMKDMEKASGKLADMLNEKRSPFQKLNRNFQQKSRNLTMVGKLPKLMKRSEIR